ncbi:Dyrk-family kinase pom1 [Thalictrum thalictroides]|uniref:Dyrk-family kinase pom1 n=1 Tax=Thalictrum thalictroides TaxID=46969 RepID=A0A7J6WA68_THATH|nr:Dyrk-family kinase pom1 [Thalictrum thalictroides]
MEVSNIETVLEFLRKNGLSEAECALRDDINEKGDLGSFTFEKFEFPMSPPAPPPVRIPLDHRKFDVSYGKIYGFGSSSDSSSEDFVSMDSFFGSPSGFINPYGIRTGTRLKSEVSSTDFGTARDYRDSDILNDIFWYDEKDDDYLKHSSFGRTDFFTCPTEDKFVTTSETEGGYDEPSEDFHAETSFNCLEKSIDYEDDFKVKDCYHLDEGIGPEQDMEPGLKRGTQTYDSSAQLCDCCTRLKEYHGGESEYCHQLKTLEEDLSGTELRHLCGVSSDCAYVLENKRNDSYITFSEKHLNKNDGEELQQVSGSHPVVAEKSSLPYKDCNYEREDGKETVGASYDPVTVADGEECNTPDELHLYKSHEDEYEVFNLRIIHRKNKTGFEENKDIPIILNTILAGRYYVTEYLGSAAFSKVIQAHDLHTGVNVCLKIIKNDKDFFDQSLDEIKLLKFVNKHDPADENHILRLYDYFYHQEHLFIVCELLRANLYEFSKFNQDSGGEAYFTLSRLQIITRQCLEALRYLHHLGIIHCDLKPENILIKSYSRCEIKVIDLGSSCFKTDNLGLYVQSRSYRAPEVILGLPYDPKIDIWSLGCILAELCSGDVLFPNDGLVTLLERMIGMFGPIDMEMLVKGQETHKYFTDNYEYLYHINEETSELVYVIPEKSSLENHLKVSDIGFIEFVKFLLEINPSRRPTAIVELPTTTTSTADQQQDLPPQPAQVINNDEVKQDDYEDQKINKLTVVLDLDETLVCAYETSSLPDIIRNRAIESGLKWFDLECLSLEKESDGKPKVNHVTVFERPGLQEFLEKVNEFADLVLFTAGLESYARPLVDRIDVDNRFVSRLYRPSTTSTECREHVKDLLCISKDLSRVVIVDNNPFSFVLQPRNGIPCIPFSAGQPYDVQLLEVLLPLLKRLSLQEDVRPVLYNRFHMPEWFQQHGILTLDWSL